MGNYWLNLIRDEEFQECLKLAQTLTDDLLATAKASLQYQLGNGVPPSSVNPALINASVYMQALSHARSLGWGLDDVETLSAGTNRWTTKVVLVFPTGDKITYKLELSAILPGTLQPVASP